MKRKEILCPYCGKELDCVDVYDTDSWDNITLTNECYGRCCHCNKKWTWKEDFVFTNAYKFKEEAE